MPSILLHGRTFSYNIVRKPIRSLNLRFVGSSELLVTCPRLTPDFIVTKFINSHSSWIVKNALHFSPKKSLLSLKTVRILDVDYEILIKKSARDSVVIFNDEHKIYANTSAVSEVHLRRLFDAKFRPFAMALIANELRSLSHQFGFHYVRVSVKNTSSRFGSCSSVGNLNFNWQIILFPSDCFRHVLLHELCHTVHHNHSQNFWKLLAACDPHWRLHRTWLKQEGSRYFIV